MTITKDDGFLALKRFIEQTLKIQCSNYKEDYIKRRSAFPDAFNWYHDI